MEERCCSICGNPLEEGEFQVPFCHSMVTACKDCYGAELESKGIEVIECEVKPIEKATVHQIIVEQGDLLVYTHRNANPEETWNETKKRAKDIKESLHGYWIVDKEQKAISVWKDGRKIAEYLLIVD